MKKLAILFLLTTVLIGGVFAEASVKADLRFQNLTGANEGDMVPRLALVFAGSGTQELGPGALTFALQLTPTLNFTDKATIGMDLSGDDNFGDISYALAAGPGTLKFGLKLFAKDLAQFVWEPHVDYDGIAVGPVSLGFGLWYDFKTYGLNSDGEASVFGKYGSPSLKDIRGILAGDPYAWAENKSDEFGLRIGAAFDFGLNVTYKFVYGIGIEEVAKIVYLDVNYQVIEPLVVGLELDNTGKDFTNNDMGFTLKPYANYVINENMSAGAYFFINNLVNDVDADIDFAPGVWFKYAL